MIGILLFFIIYCFKNFKHAVFATAVIWVIMPQWSSGITGVKLAYIVIIFQCMFYFVWIRMNKREVCLDSYPKWIGIPCALAGLGYMLSNQFGDMHNLPITVVNIINYFLYPYIVFKLIKSKRDLLVYTKVMFTFFVIVCGYAIVEAVLFRNIIVEIAQEMNLIEGIMGTEDVEERFGFARCSSILSYSSALGMTSSITFFIYLYLKSKGFSIGKIKDRLLLILLPLCVLLSGTRSQMIVFVVCVLPFMFYENFKKTKTYKVMLTMGGLAILLFSSFFLMIVDSIIHSDKTGGSSSEMRMEQLGVCLLYFESAPWFGHGKNYIWEYVRPVHPELLGAESVWFAMIVDYGIVGCITYLLIIIGLVVWLYRYDKILCFLPLAFLVGKTISIVIGIELNYVIITSIVLVKIHQLMSNTPHEAKYITA